MRKKITTTINEDVFNQLERLYEKDPRFKFRADFIEFIVMNGLRLYKDSMREAANGPVQKQA